MRAEKWPKWIPRSLPCVWILISSQSSKRWRAARGGSKSFLAAEAIAAYVELNAWQIAEIEAGIAELDAGQVVSEEQATEHYKRLLTRR
jgi:RHH-type transcriptional regulator, rel operon repressor / antitoxin RelB